MLQKFRVQNYKNFRNDLEIDFSDVSGYRFSQDCITDGFVGKMMIYGKNGSGKTNLGYALCDLKTTLGFSSDINSSYSFISNADSDSDITTFEYTFLFHDGKDMVVYTYSKSDIMNMIREKMTVNDRVIYDYDFTENCFAAMDDEYFRNTDIYSVYQNHTNTTLPFLRWCVNNGVVDRNSVFQKIYHFGSAMTQILTPSTSSLLLSKNELDSLEKNVKELENFLNQMGIHCALTMEKLPDGTKELYFVFQNRKVAFLENASSGTISLFNFFIHFLMPHMESSILYFDEFDAFFHYELSERIVQYIKEKYSDSLVIFTTHNTNLMTNRIMRPDTLFLLSENGRIISLYNATDRELREGHNLGKLYMNGEFDVS